MNIYEHKKKTSHYLKQELTERKEKLANSTSYERF